MLLQFTEVDSGLEFDGRWHTIMCAVRRGGLGRCKVEEGIGLRG